LDDFSRDGDAMTRAMVILGSLAILQAGGAQALAAPIFASGSGTHIGSMQLTMSGLSTTAMNSNGEPNFLRMVAGSTYNIGPVALDTNPPGKNHQMPGGAIGNNRIDGSSGWQNSSETGTANFQPVISFNGSNGTTPQVTISGPVQLCIAGGNIASDLNGSIVPDPTKAVLSGWTTASGIPMSLISQYMNLGNDSNFSGQVGGSNQGTIGMSLTFTPSMSPLNVSPVPEPGTLAGAKLILAGLGVRAYTQLRKPPARARSDGQDPMPVA